MNITGKELRQKYLDFFKNYPGLEHHVLESAPLVPSDEEQLEGKEKVLFTTAGMQPLIPYLTGKKEPPFTRLVDCQKCVRTDDIEEVGDNTHHTFFEMLGNWSIGDYWKKEAIELSYKFLVEELGIDKNKLFVTVFEGDEDAPRDEDAANAWKVMGISEERISYLSKADNWWPTSRKEPDGTWKNAFGPCGPDTEIFYWTGEGEPEGRPETDERWVEIWNNVFMQYNRKEDGTLEELPTKNVDTGMGLERTLSILTGKKNAYETDLFLPTIKVIEDELGSDVEQTIKRIIADHMRSAVFLISEGVFPGNKSQNSVVRTLIRRAAFKSFTIDKDKSDSKFFGKIVEAIVKTYPESFNEEKVAIISEQVSIEVRKFRNTLERGIKEIDKVSAFDMFQSYGFPKELIQEVYKERGKEFDANLFDESLRKHQEASRSASAGAFKGGLAGHSDVEIKYHTITHLLHQALRDVLGESVYQKGSNITPERLRFDFSFDRKMTEEEIRETERVINERIAQDLQVDHMTIPIEEARAKNAIGLFDDKYAKEVSVYAIGPNFSYDPKSLDKRERGGYYSMEFCGGPHVEHTGKIGKVIIQREEAVAAGIRRIRAVVSN